MNDDKEIVYRPTRHSTKKLRCTRRRRFSTSIIVEGLIVLSANVAIASLLLSCFLGVAAMGSWGLEIIHTTDPNIIVSRWYFQKRVFLGGAVVSFSSFLAAALMGAFLSVGRDE